MQHRDHATPKCNKATQQQIHEACQDIANADRLADVRIDLSMSHLNKALQETELISQMLNQQGRGFEQLAAHVKRADNDLAQEDLAASLQAATDLKQKFEQALSFAVEAGKSLESVLRDSREKLEDLFPPDEELVETDDSGASRNNFDLCIFDDDQEAIDLRACRIEVVPDLSRFTDLKFLGFRRNLLTSINDNIMHTTLKELDLNDNKITEIRGLDALVNLEILNIGYNRICKIQGLTSLVKLKIIYLMHNGIRKIEGLEMLVNLELLDLEHNRIETIEGLDNQHKLRELYLEKNRIRRIENISHLTELCLLSIEGNRVTKLENLETLVSLEELYVAEQGISTFDGIQTLNKLKLIDGAKNSIASLDHLGHLQQLERLWLNHNNIAQWARVDKLAKLPKLRNVRLEGNPVQSYNRPDYRRKVIQALPQVAELDDTPCA